MAPVPAFGLAVAVASIFAGQWLTARAGRQLTSEQRNQVITIGAYRRAVRMILVMGLGLWMLLLAFLRLPVASLIRWAMLVLPVPLAVWLHITYFEKLRALGLPSSYVRAHESARYVVYAGCALGAVLVYLGSR